MKCMVPFDSYDATHNNSAHCGSTLQGDWYNGASTLDSRAPELNWCDDGNNGATKYHGRSKIWPILLISSWILPQL